MYHVFVETNWVHDYAAPAHHKVPEAVTLLERAKRGEFILHIPNVSFAEARQSIQTKCQPVDGPGIHRYIRWAHGNGELNDEQAREAHRLADRYVQGINKELNTVPSLLKEVAGLPCVKVFAFDEERRRAICANCTMTPTFGCTATSLCNSLHVAPTLNSPSLVRG